MPFLDSYRSAKPMLDDRQGNVPQIVPTNVFFCHVFFNNLEFNGHHFIKNSRKPHISSWDLWTLTSLLYLDNLHLSIKLCRPIPRERFSSSMNLSRKTMGWFCQLMIFAFLYSSLSRPKECQTNTNSLVFLVSLALCSLNHCDSLVDCTLDYFAWDTFCGAAIYLYLVFFFP